MALIENPFLQGEYCGAPISRRNQVLKLCSPMESPERLGDYYIVEHVLTYGFHRGAHAGKV